MPLRVESGAALAVAAGLCALVAFGTQVEAKRGARSAQPASRPAATAAATETDSSRAALERRFERMLAGAALRGTWQTAEFDDNGNALPLGEPRSDCYTISQVEKIGAAEWLVSARIQVGADTDLTIPVPVTVRWAGDTPVITLDNAGLPGLGVYSARVMVFGGLYSGTWFGPGHGGVMSGRIVHETNTAATRPSASQTDRK